MTDDPEDDDVVRRLSEAVGGEKSTPSPDVSTATGDMAKTMASMLEGQLGIIVELTGGYRNRLVAAGIGEEAADQMAISFHDAVLERVMPQTPAPKGSGRRRG